MDQQIYLDYNSTTPCDNKVLEKMIPYFNMIFGNASSTNHSFGWKASGAIENATNSIAKFLKVKPSEIIYTSGATESINSILRGVCGKFNSSHIITLKTEHKATLDVCSFMEEKGVRLTYLDVDQNGIVNINDLDAAITKETKLVSIMYANNETGVIQPIKEISKVCKRNNVLFFSDATQALGKIELKNFFSHVDYACFSAHKVYGPKGIGITFIKNSSKRFLDSYILGGGQQKNLRGGTYNVPSIVGFSEAIELFNFNFLNYVKRTTKLRNNLQKGLLKIEEVNVNCISVKRLPNTLNISFKFVDGEKLLNSLSRYIAVSNGSACNSQSVKPSHVLIAMGIPENLCFSSLRISIGKNTTESEVNKAIQIITKEVAVIRSSNLLWKKND